jgi:hypothetical protein
MQCPSCGKTGFVNVGGKRYCSSCGAKLADQGAPRAMSDIKPNRVAPPKPEASTVAITSVPSSSSTVLSANNVPKAAGQFHGSPSAGSAKVLDLRAAPATPPKPNPVPVASVTDTTPNVSDEEPVAISVTPPAAVFPQPTVVNDTPTPIAPEMPEPVEAAAATPLPPSSGVHMPVVTSSLSEPTITPFAGTPPSPPQDLMQPAPPTPTSAPASSSTHPLVKRFPVHPAVAETEPAASPLPNDVASQVNKLAEMAEKNQASDSKSPDLQQALNAAKTKKSPGLLKIGAALTAIAIMGGFVWLQNSPKLAFHAAATRAGIEASLPTYIPSSYQQNGPAQVDQGQLTLNFRSPSTQEQLSITQKRTDWDSNSLRENFVSRQSDKFVAVSGQGLTIFLYNDKASWVNHGIWYNVSGTSKLSREQVIKVAYGL